jgi:hypothetical protein
MAKVIGFYVFFESTVNTSVLFGFDDDREEISIDILPKKTSLNEIPKFAKKGKSSEIPGLFEGFKMNRRR